MLANRKNSKPKKIDELMAGAELASSFLKALASDKRLMLLCLLAEGDKAVSELTSALGMQQSSVSQQLARLRAENMVTFKRDGRTIHYALASDEVRRTIGLLYELFCAPKAKNK